MQTTHVGPGRVTLGRWLRVAGLWAATAMPLWAQTPVAPPPAGEVVFSRGAGLAQAPGQAARTLGKGLPLSEGDRLTTSAGGTAIIRLNDGTRMTLRPESELVLQRFQYQQDALDNSLLLDLLRGGFRALTGLVNKDNASAATVRTRTATIGIRGTDFDARICGRDCATEANKATDAARPANLTASAKAVAVLGNSHVVDPQGARRPVVQGTAVYPGELVETAARASLVLVFRDDSRVSLGADTRFKVEDFSFDAANPREGSFLMSLFRGTARALTGLIGRSNPQRVSFKTPTATIGIRGTGLDMACGDEGCSFFNWLGSITVTPEGHSALQVLQAGQGLVVTPTGLRPINVLPLPDVPRPDGVQVELAPLFSATPVPEGQDGLYVFVRDGHVQLSTPDGVVHLGRGEVGLAEPSGRVLRPLQMPRFIELDFTPLPSHPNPLLATVLGESGIRSTQQCR